MKNRSRIDEVLKKANKDNLVHRLTLLDTACYRRNGLIKTGKYSHEPPGFRNKLFEIYSKLSEADLKNLLKIRKNEKT